MFILDALQRSFETSIEILKNFTWIKVKSKKKKKKKKKKCQLLRICVTKDTNIVYLRKRNFSGVQTKQKLSG